MRLTKAIERFQRGLIGQGSSKNTIATYMRHLHLLTQHFNGTQVEEITGADLNDFLYAFLIVRKASISIRYMAQDRPMQRRSRGLCSGPLGKDTIARHPRPADANHFAANDDDTPIGHAVAPSVTADKAGAGAAASGLGKNS